MIVTLTTIPPRFALLGEALQSLAAQVHRPEAVELYLPRQYRRFPGERPALPPLPDWVRVIEVDHDHGPATKILPAARRWRGRAVDLLFCDDDMVHDPLWTTRFAALRADRPEDAVCEYGRSLHFVCQDETFRRTAFPRPRALLMKPTAAEIAAGTVELRPNGKAAHYFRKPGFVDVLYGFRGAMIRPDWLDDRAFDIPEVLWTVDDVWLSGMLERAGRTIWVGTGGRWTVGHGTASRVSPLMDHEEGGADRLEANRRCATYLRHTFGIWR